MSYQVDELIQLAFKEQTTKGTAESTFEATDVVEVESGAKIVHSPHVRNIRLVGGGYGWRKSIIGPREIGLSASLPFRTGGAAKSPGDIAKFLQASGFKQTIDAGDTGVYTFTPTAKPTEQKAFTAWMLSGNPDASSCIAQIARDVMGTCKISLDFNEAIALLSFDGKGALASIPTAGSQVTKTPSTIHTPALIGATVSIFNDTDYVPISIEFDVKATVTVTLDPTDNSGCGITVLTNREIDYTMKVYKKSSTDPHTRLYTGLVGGISVEWGVENNKFEVATTKAEVTGVDASDQDGVTCIDVSGKILDDDLTVTIDTANTIDED
jgi:hypothetical protein